MQTKKRSHGLPNEFANKKVTVMGLGRFGGGVGVTRFLISRGANVVVTDQSPPEDLADSVAALDDLPQDRLTLRLGEHRVDDFTRTELLIANPAVPPRNEYLQAAIDADVPVSTEIQLLIERLPNPRKVIGITGSAGKSTTTAMIASGIQAACESSNAGGTSGGCHIGGNFGGSLLNKLEDIQPEDWVVLELSSFMLHHLDRARWSPHIAVITNLTSNHLDWHGTFEHYQACKQALLNHQASAPGSPGRMDLCVLTRDAQQHFTPKTACILVDTTAPFSPTLPGAHNLLNAQTALTVCRAAGLSGTQARAGIEAFRGLPHRLCLVHEQNSIRYFDDSKCTTPEAAVLALKAVASLPGAGACRIILGGYDKGASWDGLAAAVIEHARAVYTIGTTGDAIADAIEQILNDEPSRPNSCGGVAWQPGPSIYRCDDLKAAMSKIHTHQKPGDVVLLSPGCASWDQFTDFQARGQLFSRLSKSK